jgi:1,2-diacylglycerol-3-alpha-glucose alpha-1,2-galactosyltransferase
MRPIRVNVISETTAIKHVAGVHSAFEDCIELLRTQPDVEVFVNSRERCDIIHSHAYGPYFFYKGLSHRSRRVVVAHVIPESAYGSIVGAKQLMPLIEWYLRRVYSFADVTIAVSPYVAKTLEEMHVRSRVVTIYYPIRTDRFRASEELREHGRRRWNIDPSQPVVLAVGQVQERKGVDTFVEVARSLPELLFVWAGDIPYVTPGPSRLKRLMAEPPPNVRFLGNVARAEMPLLYNSADMLLHPSFQDNCSYAVLEAAACELPVVLRDNKEYRSLYEDNYVTCRDTREFVSKVAGLASPGEERRHAVERSKALVRPFSADAIVRSWIELYQSLL